MARAWSNAETFKERLQICVNTAVRISSMDCGGFYLFDEADGNLNLIVHQGLSEPFILSAFRFLSGSDNARLIREGKAVYTLHCNLSSPDNEAALREGLHATAVIPVRSGEKVIGCLNVASHTQDHIPDCTRIALERMAGAIAHRFNNMMEVVMGNLELAMEDLSQNKEALDTLTEAFQASREAARISGLMLVYLGQSMTQQVPAAWRSRR